MTLAADARASWHQFLATFAELRPELYRYCRHLTRSPWDAEDLAQDALTRAFVMLAKLGAAPPNPRAWLFRVASNAWIDQQRRPRDREMVEQGAPLPADPRETREAAGTLISQLAPQERAAVVLKDVFDLSLEEIAEALSTTPNAIKAALHRGRGKLVDPVDEPRVPTPAALDRFVAAFAQRDLAAVAALLLDTSIVEVVGVSTEVGPRGNIAWGMMFGSEKLAEGIGVEARFVCGALPAPPRRELRSYRGESIMLAWYAHADGEFVRAIDRVDIEGEHVTRLRNYFFTPDVLAEVCAELGVPFRSNGYLFSLAGCA